MKNYTVGNIAYVFQFPFEERDNQNRPLGYTAPRPVLILGEGKNGITGIPVMPITTHNRKTTQNTYILRFNEVEIPKGIFIVSRKKGREELEGVVKVNRIEKFHRSQMTLPLGNVPLRLKENVISKYEELLEVGKFKKSLDALTPDHKNVMREFKESIIAEKLHFLTSENGENQFDEMKKSQMFIENIQKTGNYGDLNIYSVQLRGKKDSFLYDIATYKTEQEVAKEWGKVKRAEEWLKEDMKYHALKNNIDQKIRPDPLPHPEKYVPFENFQKSILKSKKKKQVKQQNNEIER